MLIAFTRLRVALFAASLAALLSAALAACGGDSSSGAPADDGGTMPSPDGAVADTGARSDANASADSGAGDGGSLSDGAGQEAEASATYPAFAPLFPQLVNQGGYVMKNPVIVAITWDSDPQQVYFDGFADNIGATDYWSETTSEYGVHAARSGTANHVHMATTAAQTTDTDLQNMIVAHAGVDWPAPTQDTAYVYFLPPTMTLLAPIDYTNPDAGLENGCIQFGGYHDQIQVGSVLATYAVVPSCITPSVDADGGIDYDAAAEGGSTAVQNTTISMSHELIEMSTDPHPSTPGGQGFIGLDNFALDWYYGFLDEAGDLCVFDPLANIERVETSPAPFDFWVQRTWSNKAGPEGHDPCRPGLPGVAYFNVTPLHLDPLTIHAAGQAADGGVGTVQTKGVHIPMGGTATIPIGFYSDGPAGIWDLSYQLGSLTDMTTPTYLSVTIDNAAGKNGDTAHATVTVTGTDSTYTGLELLVFVSQARDAALTTHTMPVLISSQ
jgi:hypothetical protein